ncbi:MAG: YceI family protein [Pedobacter sp.]|nr:MAG: YceI family protein [Pedobacter sp.]
MKTIKSTFLIMMILFSIRSSAQIAPTGKFVNYQLDLDQSKIFWKAPKKFTSGHYGTISLSSGNLEVAANGIPVRGNFIINMRTIRSTDQKLPAKNKQVDDQLLSPQFFDVGAYPTGTMTIKLARPTKTPGLYLISGDLTLKDTTLPIEFFAKFKTTKTGLEAVAQLTIDRLKWGINHQKPDVFSMIKQALVPDEIPVSLVMVFVR